MRFKRRNKILKYFLIPFIMLLLALVGTYLYNDQAVLNHIRAYFREVAPALDPKIMKSLTDVIQNRQIASHFILYGSLNTLVLFVLWVYYSSTIVVVGGEFAYSLEEDRQRSIA